MKCPVDDSPSLAEAVPTPCLPLPNFTQRQQAGDITCPYDSFHQLMLLADGIECLHHSNAHICKQTSFLSALESPASVQVACRPCQALAYEANGNLTNRSSTGRNCGCFSSWLTAVSSSCSSYINLVFCNSSTVFTLHVLTKSSPLSVPG